jgi:arginyl-tRNA synthetase
VVAYQQTLHFQQVFAVLQKMGYDWAKDQCEHVAFGMVSYEGEALSTRRGNIIHLDELLTKAQEKALDILNEKSPDIADKQTVARQVGVGAVVFSTLFNQRIKDIDFWWDKALNFDGETGPYVQYTYARIQTLLEKGKGITEAPNYDQLTDDESQQLALAISRFPEAVENALNRNEPYLVTRQVVEVAKAYNKFYYEHRIITDNLGEASARLNLSRAAAQVIKLGLHLIGVETPSEM